MILAATTSTGERLTLDVPDSAVTEQLRRLYGDEDRWTVEYLAKRYHKTVRTIWNMVRRGDLEPFWIGGSVFFDPEKIRAKERLGQLKAKTFTASRHASNCRAKRK